MIRLLILCWILFYAPDAFILVEATEILKNRDRPQQTFENIQMNINSESAEEKNSKLSELDFIDKTDISNLAKFDGEIVFDDDGKPGYYWRKEEKYNLGIFKSQLSIFKKESPILEIFPFKSNDLPGEDDPLRKLAVIKLTLRSKEYAFGTEYMYGGKDLTNPDKYKKLSYTESELKNDEEKIYVWGKKKIGSFDVKSFISRSWNNVDRDSDEYQMTKTFSGASLDFKLPRLPFWCSFSYSQGISESTMVPDGSTPKGEVEQNYSSSIYYFGGQAFDMNLSSSYSPSKDRLESSKETETFWHEISANIRPTYYVTISPTLSFGEYKYLWYGERTENPSASLSVSLSELFKTVDLYLWGYYSRMRGTDGYQDDMIFNTSVGISWKAKYFSSLPEMNFSLDLDYTTYIDKIYSESSSDAIGTFFSVKFPF